MKANGTQKHLSISEIGKKFAYETTTKISLAMAIFGFLAVLIISTLTTKNTLNQFFYSTENYLNQLLSVGDIYELSRHMNSGLNSDTIAGYLIIEKKGNHLLSQNGILNFQNISSISSSSPFFNILNGRPVQIKNYTLTQKNGVGEVSVILAGYFSIIPALVVFSGIFILSMTHLLITRRKINEMSQFVSNPLVNFNHFLKHSQKDLNGRFNLSSDLKYKEIEEISEEFYRLTSEIQTTQKENERLLVNESFVEVASQVAHDIQSPLAALKSVATKIESIPEGERLLLRHAVQRIGDIANDLTLRAKKSSDNLRTHKSLPKFSNNSTVFSIYSLVDSIMSEKRLQQNGKSNAALELHVDSEAYFAFIQGSKVELSRAISNLLNNALESIPKEKAGKVTVNLKRLNDRLILKILDNGVGIPKNLLKKLGERGVTFGKNQGSGLGLYHAKKVMQAAEGDLEIQSEVNVGTVVTLSFPCQPAPNWFLPSLNLTNKKRIIILDDDESIHQVWNDHLSQRVGKKDPVSLLHFYSTETIFQWLQQDPSSANLKENFFLFDHEILHEKKTGLDLIEHFNLSQSACLVTSRHDENLIKTRCEEIGLKILPKELVPFISIEGSNHAL
jgi:signal transduction histidine kinase